jgi:hypothetical protein
MFDKDEKNLQLLLIEKILTTPPNDGNRWERNQFSPEQEDKRRDEELITIFQKLLTSAVSHGVNSPEVQSRVIEIEKERLLHDVKLYLQFVKNTVKYSPEERQAAQALLTTYGFNEEEETTDHKPEFKKNTPSSWEEYKKLLMWGSDMDPKQLKNLSPEERKKRLDKFFNSTHHK